VCRLSGFSYPKILEWMKQGTFPRARSLANRNVWLSQEVCEWIANLPASPLTNTDAADQREGAR
jgi:predicted DNA-binding transcriptional regulator AlpA